MGLVQGGGGGNPGSSFWAGSEGAIVLGPGRVSVWSDITSTFVVGSATSVSTASVRAVGVGHGEHGEKGDENFLGEHFLR